MKNRTLNVINRQLKAMGCSLFEIGIRHQTSGKMMNRSWSLEQILKSVPWLQRMNAQGNDILYALVKMKSMVWSLLMI